MNIKSITIVFLIATLFFDGFLVFNGKREYHVPIVVPTPEKAAPGKLPVEIPPVEQPPEVKKVPVFINMPIISSRVNEKSLYADIMNRAKNPFTTESRPTNAHESTHDLNSMIRNSNGSGHNGLYVLEGRGVIIDEPKMRKSAIAAFIPKSLIGYRHKLYIAGQKEWDDMPTYILDEWVAYNNGGAVAVEDKKEGRRVPSADEVSGVVEFSIYSTALAMAIEKNDPEYWANNVQFKNFMDWELKRAKKIFDEGKDIPEFSFKSQETLYANLNNSSDAEAMRAFLKKHFDSVWLDK